jgi:hypothetical protein
MADGDMVTPNPGGTRPPQESALHAQDVLRTALRLLHMIEKADVDELIQVGLDEAERLSGSRIGYFHFVNADQETIRLHNWSTRTKTMCTTVEENHYPIAVAGIWVDCIHCRRPVYHNDYAAEPHRKGLPDGHVPLLRDLSAPIFEDGRIVAVMGVGNKPADYDEYDVELVNLMAETVWSAVTRKRVLLDLEQQVEQRTLELQARNDELARALAEIKTLSGILPICSHCKQIRDDQGYWNRIEAFVAQHSTARFSHSICPDCLARHYPDLASDVQKDLDES